MFRDDVPFFYNIGAAERDLSTKKLVTRNLQTDKIKEKIKSSQTEQSQYKMIQTDDTFKDFKGDKAKQFLQEKIDENVKINVATLSKFADKMNKILVSEMKRPTYIDPFLPSYDVSDKKTLFGFEKIFCVNYEKTSTRAERRDEGESFFAGSMAFSDKFCVLGYFSATTYEGPQHTATDCNHTSLLTITHLYEENKSRRFNVENCVSMVVSNPRKEDEFLVGFASGELILLNVETCLESATSHDVVHKCHCGPVTSSTFVYRGNEEYIASAAQDGSIIVWKYTPSAPLFTRLALLLIIDTTTVQVEGYAKLGGITCFQVFFHQVQETVEDGINFILGTESGQVAHIRSNAFLEMYFTDHMSKVNDISIQKSDDPVQLFATCSQDGYIMIRKLSQSEPLFSMICNQFFKPLSVQYLPDYPNVLLCVYDNGSTRIYQLDTDEFKLVELYIFSNRIYAASIDYKSKDLIKVALCSNDDKVVILPIYVKYLELNLS